MSRRNLPRLMLVAILASLLALAGPAQSQAAELPHPERIRHWLVNLWETGISALLPWYKTGPAQSLGSVTPNGGTTQGNGSPGTTSNGSGPQGDYGPGIDPNG